MKKPTRRLLFPLAAIPFVTSAAAQSTLYWNPSPLSDDWANPVWAATSGGSPSLSWTAGDNAVFDQAGTYTATIGSAQTAGSVTIGAGNVTLSGSLLSSTSINISSGASLTAGAATILKSGTTAFTVDGTWNFSGASSGQRISIAGGSGNIIASGSLRTGGNVTFDGNISGSVGIITDAGGTFTLGGNNTYSGNSLFRHGNTIRLNSANAISSNSWLRFGAGTNIIQLAAGDFSRTLGGSGGQVHFHGTVDGAGSSGFAAIGADRNVAINGSVVWGTTSTGSAFNPATFHLGTSASTHSVTLTTNIDLGGAARTISVENGSAAVGGRISGSLTNGTLTKVGTGTLVLSGTNSFGSNLIFGTSSTNLGAIRLESDDALGGVTVIEGNSGTGSAQARIELANNVTISGIEYRAGGRSSATTTGASIVNISGNNEWAGTIRISNTGGSYGIRSDAGNLTISGSLRNGIGSARTWDLTGAGGIVLSGTVIDASTGSLALNKSGAGTLEITGNSNTYSGGTTMSAGTVLANNSSGSATGTGNVTVNGGTLGGTGSISGSVTINSTGTLSPGASIESLDTGALSFTTGASFLYELNTSSPNADLLNANGDLSFDGTVSLDLSDLGTAAALAFGTKFTLISYFGTWDGDTFAGYADDSTFVFSGNEWLINYNDTSTGAVNGGLYSNAVTLSVIPEPAAALLGSLGTLLLLRRRR